MPGHYKIFQISSETIKAREKKVGRWFVKICYEPSTTVNVHTQIIMEELEANVKKKNV